MSSLGQLPRPLSIAFSYGYLGVDFFFVLSGFIIYYVNHARVGSAGWRASYIESRVTRIYLPYLPLVVGLCLAYLALPRIASADNHWNWFSTLTLLPSHNGPALAVAWTLQHEVIFYGMALLFLYFRKVLLGCVLGAIAAVAYHWTFGGSYRGFSLIDLEFLFGIAAAWCVIERKGPGDVVLALAGVAVCASFFVINDRNLSAIFGLGVALLLLPVVRAEASERIRVGASALLLGNASYAIYLVHHPMISVIARAMQSFAPLFTLAVLIAVPVAAGIAYHLMFELPLLKRVRRLLSTRPGLADATAGALTSSIRQT